MIRVTLLVLLLLSACSLDVGNSSSEDEDNDITTIDNSDNSNSGRADVLCVGVGSVDGAGGFLWKPQSQKDGALVVLFPKEYDEEFLSVEAERLDGDFDAGTFDGFTNGARQTWRFPDVGSAYTGRLYVDAGNQECAWRVTDPAEIQD